MDDMAGPYWPGETAWCADPRVPADAVNVPVTLTDGQWFPLAERAREANPGRVQWYTPEGVARGMADHAQRVSALCN
jgi:hypothetical protein